MYFEPAAFFMARSPTREDVPLKRMFIPRIVGFVYRKSRDEMLEDKRPAGFQPQRAVRWSQQALSAVIASEGSRAASNRRGRTNLPVDRLCPIYAAGDPFHLADEVPGRLLRDSAPLW